MKFGPIIEYKMRKVSLEKSYIKCGRETKPRLNLKLELTISME